MVHVSVVNLLLSLLVIRFGIFMQNNIVSRAEAEFNHVLGKRNERGEEERGEREEKIKDLAMSSLKKCSHLFF